MRTMVVPFIYWPPVFHLVVMYSFCFITTSFLVALILLFYLKFITRLYIGSMRCLHTNARNLLEICISVYMVIVRRATVTHVGGGIFVAQVQF